MRPLSVDSAAADAGLPLLAVCRGFQELNVAFGGTAPELHTLPELGRHREDKGASVERQYGPRARCPSCPVGLLARITGRDSAVVNSVHGQGIGELGDGLAVEATAPDGLIEAVTAVAAPGFVLGVQWHPEWRIAENPVSMAIFRAFGDACRRFRR